MPRYQIGAGPRKLNTSHLEYFGVRYGRMKPFNWGYRLVTGLLLLGSLAAPTFSQGTTQPAKRQADAVEGSKFLRFTPSAQGGALEASVVTYRNAAGQTVDLIAAVHIADPSFFHDLDRSFAQYDSLLYEMVKSKDADMSQLSGPGTRGPTTRRSSARGLGWVGMLQQFMKNSLDLSFQLEEIDYSRKNFVHADLDVDTFFQMQEDRGESMFTLMIQQMLHELARQDAGEAPEVGVADLLMALQKPDRNRQLKLVLAKQFNQIDELSAGIEGPNGSVLVTERNKAALKVLKQRLEAGDKKIGIFYGAAHLKGMEKILTDEMGFKQVGEPKWNVAWNMNTPPATAPAGGQ